MRTTLLTCLFTLAACSSSPSEFDGSHDLSLDLVQQDTARDFRLTLTNDLRAKADLVADLPACTLQGVYSSKDPQCNQCAEDRCCTELNGCFAEPQCDDLYVNCMLACVLAPDPDAGVNTCLEQCAGDYPLGQEKYQVAMGCAETRCLAECP